jgi:hypothetical protein
MGNPGSYGIHVFGKKNFISGNLFEGPIRAVGKHTGTTGSAILEDNTKSWTINSHTGYRLFNQTQQKAATITANTATTATGALSGSATWTNGDFYTLGPTIYIVLCIQGDSNTMTGNIVRDVGDVERVVDTYGNDNLFAGNEVSNLLWSGYMGIHPDIFQRFGTAPSHRWIIENNYFHDLDAQIGINENSVGNSAAWIFRNNIFANITQRCMLANQNSQWYNLKKA